MSTDGIRYSYDFHIFDLEAEQSCDTPQIIKWYWNWNSSNIIFKYEGHSNIIFPIKPAPHNGVEQYITVLLQVEVQVNYLSMCITGKWYVYCETQVGCQAVCLILKSWEPEQSSICISTQVGILSMPGVSFRYTTVHACCNKFENEQASGLLSLTLLTPSLIILDRMKPATRDLPPSNYCIYHTCHDYFNSSHI